jgi:hypothetical protein
MDAKRLPGAYRIGEQSDKPLAALVYVFSKGDTEKRFVRGGDRHTMDAEKFSTSGRNPQRTLDGIIFTAENGRLLALN